MFSTWKTNVDFKIGCHPILVTCCFGFSCRRLPL